MCQVIGGFPSGGLLWLTVFCATLFTDTLPEEVKRTTRVANKTMSCGFDLPLRVSKTFNISVLAIILLQLSLTEA